jgi:hypothetical protein
MRRAVNIEETEIVDALMRARNALLDSVSSMATMESRIAATLSEHSARLDRVEEQVLAIEGRLKGLFQ